MGCARLLVIAALAACGSSHASKPADAPGKCTGDQDCTAPTPACDVATGACVECRFSAQCGGDRRICDAEACRTATSCQELASELPGLPAGVYTIDPDGSGAGAAFSAYCETAAGGGWTLVQRTVWAWADSRQLLTDFATWAGTTLGMPDPGHAYRLAGTTWPALAAKGDLMIVHRLRTGAGGACAPLYYVATGGAVTVDVASSTAQIANLAQPVPILSDPNLSTSNTGADTVCVNMYSGVPWFYAMCCATCPTFQGGYWLDEPHPMESYTDTADALGHTESTACAGQSIVHDQAGSTFRGVDSMEIFLR